MAVAGNLNRLFFGNDIGVFVTRQFQQHQLLAVVKNKIAAAAEELEKSA